ncbi:hypothetical protein ABVT39_004033 [Epinephelus coioides]
MPATTRIISNPRMSDKAKNAKSGNTPTEQIPAYEPDIPEPKCRADLIKHWFKLSLDDKTANKMLWIGEEGAKVARMTDDVTCPVLDRPERYEYSPQVLCKEGILGFRGYWEVEFTGWVVVGVAYERAGRRNTDGYCGLGENEESWGLGWCGSSYQAWHKGDNVEIKDVPKYTTIGKKVKSIKKEKTNTDWIHLTLDDKTANKMLWISDNGSKVCRRTQEVCPVLDRPERYEYSPQVVCKEGIWNTRAYWEVEYSGWVVIGATYEGAGRRANCGPSGLGENEESWGLCWSGTCYQIWFNCVNKDINDVPYCSTIGVYIDQPAGIMSFYAVSGEGAEREVKLLQKVKTTIEKKILPGFWMGIESSCTILKRPE